MNNLVAECDLNPDRRQFYFAELIRLRGIAECMSHCVGSLPRKVREVFSTSLPPKSLRQEWIEVGMEEAIEQDMRAPLQQEIPL